MIKIETLTKVMISSKLDVYSSFLLSIGREQLTGHTNALPKAQQSAYTHQGVNLIGACVRFEAHLSFKLNPPVCAGGLVFNWSEQSRAFCQFDNLGLKTGSKTGLWVSANSQPPNGLR